MTSRFRQGDCRRAQANTAYIPAKDAGASSPTPKEHQDRLVGFALLKREYTTLKPIPSDRLEPVRLVIEPVETYQRVSSKGAHVASGWAAIATSPQAVEHWTR